MMNKTSVTLNKPIYAGFCILELSKYLMYDYHYNHILQKYHYNDVKLLFTDTDSLCYLIKTKDIYKDMLDHKELYDMSNHYNKYIIKE